jgi:hypothetical protein
MCDKFPSFHSFFGGTNHNTEAMPPRKRKPQEPATLETVGVYGWVGLIFPLKCAGPGTKGFT